MQDSKVVDINVGGRHLTTSLSTLTKYPDSMLAAMFSGRHPVAKDKDGRYFIDVDGDVFVHILNFLRFGKMPPPERAQEVNEYAEYFGLQELKAPVTEDFEKVLYGVWKMKLPDYQSQWEYVKRKLKDLYSTFFYIRVSRSECRYMRAAETVIPEDNEVINIIDFQFNKSILLNLLAVDLKRLNIFTDYCLRVCPGCGCQEAMRFKIG
ncbi:uncharacterized protein [Haliotis cracherodii]|uniref:uncharacterized protein n=1 Tax=Haliotis cracherodii TaxID=6455 RepID=UPI0039EBC67B